jgi:hypothetical protein
VSASLIVALLTHLVLLQVKVGTMKSCAGCSLDTGWYHPPDDTEPIQEGVPHFPLLGVKSMGIYHSAISHRSKVHPGGAVHHMVADGLSWLSRQHVPVSLPLLLLLLSSLLICLALSLPTFDSAD